MESEALLVLAALSEPTQVIGAQGKIPWGMLSGDAGLLRILTVGKPSALIMGRLTFESIGRLLPKRVSVILTANPKPEISSGDARGVFVRSLDEALEFTRTRNLQPVIFGGEKVYEEALQRFKCTVYLTRIKQKFGGDALFPLHLLSAESKENISQEVRGALENCPEHQKKPRKWTENNGIFSENGLEYYFTRTQHAPRTEE